LNPIVLTVAPNGASKQKADHPALPLTPEELAERAARCLEAGAAMLHLHVRDRDGRHLLEADAYRAALSAIRARVGSRQILQTTSESGRRYAAPEQMAVIRAVRPEACSAALRELCPDAASEREAAAFFAWLSSAQVMTQVILYAADEYPRWRDLRRRGVIPDGPWSLLFVLGRYSAGQVSDPRELLPFLAAHTGSEPWSLCAFGPREAACVLAAAAFGGHARVGFENNLLLPDGAVAPGNEALVANAAAGAKALGRRPATADEARKLFLG
jgi:3-keto-5-aminohexanoate cleavage enzyme